MTGNRIRVAVIGCGPHFDKTHFPFLVGRQSKIQLALAVDTVENSAATAERLVPFGSDVEQIDVEAWGDGPMPPHVADRLTEVVKRLEIDAVIIATEPLAHFGYLLWGMTTDAHLFVDKPIIMSAGASTSVRKARALGRDLAALVEAGALRRDRLIAVGTQRRYHCGLAFAFDTVLEASARFGTPVTFMQSSHADGQFRLPIELETITYHGYHDYGKIGHSGYHLLAEQSDLAMASARAAGVAFDELTSFGSAVRPEGFLQQVPPSTYEKYFGKEQWRAASPDSHEALAARMKTFGEMDVALTNTFNREGTPVLLSQISLIHNSVSRRSALAANPDLYKSNGRIKHESHTINVGPFLTVQVHSYQSRSRRLDASSDERALGGSDSFEVHLYRNAAWYGPKAKPFEKVLGDDLAERSGMSESATFTGYAKELMMEDFFSSISGERDLTEHRSRLDSHLLGGTLLSAACETVASGNVARRALSADLFTTEVAR